LRAANLADAEGLNSEQDTMAELTGRTARSDYLGATDRVIDLTLGRARLFLKETS